MKTWLTNFWSDTLVLKGNRPLEQTDKKDGQNLATSICLDVKTQIYFLSKYVNFASHDKTKHQDISMKYISETYVKRDPC